MSRLNGWLIKIQMLLDVSIVKLLILCIRYIEHSVEIKIQLSWKQKDKPNQKMQATTNKVIRKMI